MGPALLIDRVVLVESELYNPLNGAQRPKMDLSSPNIHRQRKNRSRQSADID